ncbi:MAG TPA: SAM-dependent methyltransferase [Pyrinomonadaceae bacterium]
MSARQPKPEDEQTNRLGHSLRQRILRDGPLPFNDWMEAALYDAEDGYYSRRDLARWGRDGDYLTSPVRSSLFAATFARYFAGLYEELGAPARWTIIEAGAGAGHFAAGVLETLRRDYPKAFASARYMIDEASADSIERARARLARFGERVAFGRLREMAAPAETAIIFANELLDAFPAHRVLMRDGRLRELCVGCDASGRFVWLECSPSTPRLDAYFRQLQITLAEGQTAEVNLAAEDWIARSAALFERGFLIAVDYGAEAEELFNSPDRRSGTLRAFRQHQFSDDVLARPGEQDLTATVNWTSIRNACAAASLQTTLFERQDKFLLQAGLLEQLERLTAGAQSEAEAVSLRAEARHMILPDSMSASFQVLVQKKSDV